MISVILLKLYSLGIYISLVSTKSVKPRIIVIQFKDNSTAELNKTFKFSILAFMYKQ